MKGHKVPVKKINELLKTGHKIRKFWKVPDEKHEQITQRLQTFEERQVF